jgi:hypothetical protein
VAADEDGVVVDVDAAAAAAAVGGVDGAASGSALIDVGRGARERGLSPPNVALLDGRRRLPLSDAAAATLVVASAAVGLALPVVVVIVVVVVAAVVVAGFGATQPNDDGAASMQAACANV